MRCGGRAFGNELEGLKEGMKQQIRVKGSLEKYLMPIAKQYLPTSYRRR